MAKPKKIADYLYYMEYKDYQPLQDPIPIIKMRFACSGVRNGNFHGRNLDLNYADVPEVVIKMDAKPGRFASVGIAANILRTSQEFKETTEEEWQALPNFTFDGINENGVVTQVNVVPAPDLNFMTLRETNPGKPRVHASTIVRYVLDHAKTAAHAVELMNELDIYGGFGETWGLHWLVSDPKESFVVECIDGKLVAQHQNIMTNFYNNFSAVIPEQMAIGEIRKSFPRLTPCSNGIERYEILREHYFEGNTLEGMSNLMQRVRFSQCYEEENSPVWYSDYLEPGGELSLDNKPEDFEETLKKNQEVYQLHDRNYDGDNYWITWNTSVYDLENRTMRVFVQEDYKHPYDFSLEWQISDFLSEVMK